VREPQSESERAFWALFKIFTRQNRFNPTKNDIETRLSSILPPSAKKVVIHGMHDLSPASFALIRALNEIETDIVILICEARGFKNIYSPCNKLQSLLGIRASHIVCTDVGEYPSRKDALHFTQIYDHTNIETFETHAPDMQDCQEYIPVLHEGSSWNPTWLGAARPYFTNIKNEQAFFERLKHYNKMYSTVQNMQNDLGEKLRLLSFYHASQFLTERAETLNGLQAEVSVSPKDFFELPGAVILGQNIVLSHLSDIYFSQGDGLPWPLTPELLHACGNKYTNTYLYFRLCRPMTLMCTLFHTLYFSKTPVCVLSKGAAWDYAEQKNEETPEADFEPNVGNVAFSRFEKIDFYLCPEKFFRDFVCGEGITIDGYNGIRRFYEYLIVDQVWKNHTGVTLEHIGSAQILASKQMKKLKEYFPFFDADAENRILGNATSYIFYRLLEGKNRLRAYAPSHALILLMFGAAVYPAPQEHVHPHMENYRKKDPDGDVLMLHRIRPEGQEDINEAMNEYLLSQKHSMYPGKWCSYCRHHIHCPEYRKNNVLCAE